MFTTYTKTINELLNDFANYKEWPFSSDENSINSFHSDKTDEGYILQLPIPGLTKEDIKVRVVKRNLEVKNKNENSNWVYAFERSFILPEDSDKKSINASVENGVLTIKIGIKEDDENIINVI